MLHNRCFSADTNTVFDALQNHQMGTSTSPLPQQVATPVGPPTPPYKSFPVAGEEDASSSPPTVLKILLGDATLATFVTTLCCFACFVFAP